jgi:hypothetical protein
MKGSKHIVAINKDEHAPIFAIADLGIVGVVLTMLPQLTQEVKRRNEWRLYLSPAPVTDGVFRHPRQEEWLGSLITG